MQPEFRAPLSILRILSVILMPLSKQMYEALNEHYQPQDTPHSRIKKWFNKRRQISSKGNWFRDCSTPDWTANTTTTNNISTDHTRIPYRTVTVVDGMQTTPMRPNNHTNGYTTIEWIWRTPIIMNRYMMWQLLDMGGYVRCGFTCFVSIDRSSTASSNLHILRLHLSHTKMVQKVLFTCPPPIQVLHRTSESLENHHFRHTLLIASRWCLSVDRAGIKWRDIVDPSSKTKEWQLEWWVIER